MGVSRSVLLVCAVLFVAAFSTGARAQTVVVLGNAPAGESLDALARALGGTRATEGAAWWLRVPGSRLTFVAPQPAARITDAANLAYKADGALITLDTREGPTPELTHAVLLAHQAEVQHAAILMLHTASWRSDPRGAELMKTLAEEALETLANYDLGGTSVAVFADSDAFPRAAKSQLGELAGRFPRRASVPASAANDAGEGASRRQVDADVYLLSAEEQIAVPAQIRSGEKLQIWFAGKIASAVVSMQKPLAAGENGQLRLQFDKELALRSGKRFFAYKDDALIAAGFAH